MPIVDSYLRKITKLCPEIIQVILSSKCPHQQLRKPARSPQRTSSVASTFDAERQERTSVIVWPTAEKSRSDWAELAEMQYTRRATSDSLTGYSLACCLQNSSGRSQLAGTCIALYVVACKVISTRQQNSACWLVCGRRCSISKIGEWVDSGAFFATGGSCSCLRTQVSSTSKSASLANIMTLLLLLICTCQIGCKCTH